MVQVVFLNGPPRSGKDTLVSYLTPYIACRHMKFAAPLKRAAAGFLDVSLSGIEDMKDKRPNALRRAHTYESDTVRDHLIWLFSAYSFRYGDDILGRLLWADARHSNRQLILVSDSGKGEEVGYVIKQAGSSNCLILRLHRDGCTFEGDNRTYLSDKLCTSYDLHNDGTREKVAVFALRLIQRHFPHIELLKEVSWQPA